MGEYSSSYNNPDRHSQEERLIKAINDLTGEIQITRAERAKREKEAKKVTEPTPVPEKLDQEYDETAIARSIRHLQYLLGTSPDGIFSRAEYEKLVVLGRSTKFRPGR